VAMALDVDLPVEVVLAVHHWRKKGDRMLDMALAVQVEEVHSRSYQLRWLLANCSRPGQEQFEHRSSAAQEIS